MMASKKYTAQEMREMEPFAVVVKMTPYGPVKETERTNDLKAMLRQAADALEREKKYEYAARSNYDGFIYEDHCEEEKVKNIFSCMKCEEYTVVRREVGEWEEVTG